MTEKDNKRVDRLQDLMRQAGFDCLICRLPENVVYITEHWPIHGISVAVLPQEGRPTLFIPEVEEEWGNKDWAEIVPFGWSLLKDKDLYTSYHELLTSISESLGLSRAKIGIEQDLEVVGTTYRHAEPIIPAAPWSNLLESVFAQATLLDATDLL